MRAVVVGSGFGGLAAAIRLAAAGNQVTIVCDSLGGDRGDGLTWTHLADRRCVVTV